MHNHLRSLILRCAVILAVALLGPLTRVSADEGGPLVGEPISSDQAPTHSLNFTGCSRVNVEPVNAAFEQRVVDLVNQHRASIGLPPLRRNANLDYAARYHAADMAEENYFDHDTYDGWGGTTYVCNTWTRLRLYYPNYNGAGENIAAGYSTPEAVMQGWLNSPGHRANIERASFNEIGVGYYTGPGHYGRYWAQDFGNRDLNEAELGGLPDSITFLYGLNNHQFSVEGYDLQPANTISSHILNWSVTKSGFDADWLSLNLTSGTTPSSCLHAVPVDLSTLYTSPGVHTGTLTFNATAPGGVALLNSRITVQVRLVVVETLHATFLPAVSRK